MACFSDQIKNALKSFVIKLYEIAKQYSFMSLTQVEESMGLSPITYKQELLGSRDSQGKEPAPDKATKTQTDSDTRQELMSKVKELDLNDTIAFVEAKETSRKAQTSLEGVMASSSIHEVR